MTDFTIFSRFRNKSAVDDLVKKLKEKGFNCHNFSEVPADPNNPDAHPEEQMAVYESTVDFRANPYFEYLFQKDLQGLREARTAILLLPAGISAHIEIGIAYGMGKKCILIGEPSKPESLYLLFSETYPTVEGFLASL